MWRGAGTPKHAQLCECLGANELNNPVARNICLLSNVHLTLHELTSLQHMVSPTRLTIHIGFGATKTLNFLKGPKPNQRDRMGRLLVLLHLTISCAGWWPWFAAETLDCEAPSGDPYAILGCACSLPFLLYHLHLPLLLLLLSSSCCICYYDY